MSRGRHPNGAIETDNTFAANSGTPGWLTWLCGGSLVIFWPWPHEDARVVGSLSVGLPRATASHLSGFPGHQPPCRGCSASQGTFGCINVCSSRTPVIADRALTAAIRKADTRWTDEAPPGDLQLSAHGRIQVLPQPEFTEHPRICSSLLG